MNNFRNKLKSNGWLKRLLPIIIILFAGAIAANAQTALEQQCFNLVQGKIAYDPAGNKNWNPANIRYLCRGTTLPERTVECFRVKIANGKGWEKATAECQPETMIGNPKPVSTANPVSTIKPNNSNTASGTTPAAGNMTKITGSAYDLDISAKGIVWSIGTAQRGGGFGPVGKLNYSGFSEAGLKAGSWSNVAGEGSRIAVDNNGYAWVVNQQGNIYFYSNQWFPVSGTARDIACNARGDLWIIDAQGDARLFYQETKQWGRKSVVPLNASEIAVDEQGFPWIVDVYGKIIHKDGGKWVEKPGTARSIAAGGGRVWMIDNATSALMLWNGSNWEKKHSGPFKRVAADGEGKPWVIAEGGIIYRLNL